MKIKKTLRAATLTLLTVVACLGAVYVVRMRVQAAKIPPIPDPTPALEEYAAALRTQYQAGVDARTDGGTALEALLAQTLEVTVLPDSPEEGCVTATVQFYAADTEALTAAVTESMNRFLRDYVENAPLTEKIYGEDQSYRPELVEAAFSEALKSGLSMEKVLCGDGKLEMEFADGAWSIKNAPEVPQMDVDALAAKLREKCAEGLEYCPRHYEIPFGSTSGCAPDPACYGITDDPAELQAVLDSPVAKQLIGEQTLTWNADMELIPGSKIRYYLDESILVINWKEETARAVGTYSEVFISDASQLRRKIAQDTVGSRKFSYATDFAAQTNAVLAIGGDYYLHEKINGIMVYDGKLYNYRTTVCDTCYFDGNGDMILRTRSEAGTEEEVKQLIEDNNVSFSLCWGPVIVRDGQNVTPPTYPYGEINDKYARSSIGQLGKLHYLTLNVNSEKPDYYYLVTLNDATEAMIAHGCYQAYTLDGGQTACTIMNGELINSVQFGYERPVLDIIYFATAVPKDGE